MRNAATIGNRPMMETHDFRSSAVYSYDHDMAEMEQLRSGERNVNRHEPTSLPYIAYTDKTAPEHSLFAAPITVDIMKSNNDEFVDEQFNNYYDPDVIFAEIYEDEQEDEQNFGIIRPGGNSTNMSVTVNDNSAHYTTPHDKDDEGYDRRELDDSAFDFITENETDDGVYAE